jgi:hypothetical protein
MEREGRRLPLPGKHRTHKLKKHNLVLFRTCVSLFGLFFKKLKQYIKIYKHLEKSKQPCKEMKWELCCSCNKYRHAVADEKYGIQNRIHGVGFFDLTILWQEGHFW